MHELRMWRLALALAGYWFTCGCAAEPDLADACAPSMGAYYERGCAFRSIVSGQDVSLELAIDTCETLATEPRCAPLLDAWLRCLASDELATCHDCDAVRSWFLGCALGTVPE